MLQTADKQDWPELTDDSFDLGDMEDGAYGFLARTEERGLLDVQELLEYGPEIAESTAAGGLGWAVLAGAQTKAREFEAAVESWRKAIDAIQTDKNFRATKWRMNLARVLKRLERNAEALDVLKDLAPETVDETLKPAYEALLRTLSSSA